MMSSHGKDKNASVRVSNFSEETRSQDLRRLFLSFGDIRRVFLVTNKKTGQSKGIAFIKFKRQEDAAKAIQGLNGYSYKNQILTVKWPKNSGTQ